MKKRAIMRAGQKERDMIKEIASLKKRVDFLNKHISSTRERDLSEATRFEIYCVCNSYESGFGHGVQADGMDLGNSPHSDKHLGYAYQIGYEAGLQRGAKC